MYILLAIIGAAIIGAAIHLLLPDREARGLLLSGAIATAVAAGTYTVLTWTGVGENSVWMWVGSLGGALVISLFATLAVTRARVGHDAAERARLGIA